MDELDEGFDRLEQQKLVTIETFRDLAEALLAKGRLEAAEIDACLAPHGGVYLGKESCGDLYVTDTAHEDGSDKSADVADDAAAERDEQ